MSRARSVNWSRRFDPLIKAGIEAAAAALGISEATYVDSCLLAALKSGGWVPEDAMPLGDQRGKHWASKRKLGDLMVDTEICFEGHKVRVYKVKPGWAWEVEGLPRLQPERYIHSRCNAQANARAALRRHLGLKAPTGRNGGARSIADQRAARRIAQ
jgi:hypothetical protein